MTTKQRSSFLLRGAIIGAPLFLLAALSLAGRAAEKPKVQFNRDVRSLLSDNCFYCHGPDKSHRQAGLRLDLRDEAVKSGAIVPGKPEKSKIITRILAKDASVMPPTESHKSLNAAQKQLLKQWVAEGAVYQPHWAYIVPNRPLVPKVRIAGFANRNPVDSFIQAQLVAKKIKPSAEADKRTLLRRVSLDLTGLPPTPQEMTAFLADKSPTAYEKVVDRLIASPHYGERMAAPWLDAVRYADTVGFHGDQNQNVWAYRDYVIDSFNKNKPYDRFTIEQIAGDLLLNPTPEQITATCFNRLNMMTREGGAQPKEYLAKYSADRVRTVSMAFMGSTLGCAECHDHKFDPIKQKDFYALGAFFSDLKQWGVYADYNYTPNTDLKGYNNDYPFPPEITVDSRYLKQRIADERTRIAAIASGTKTALASGDTAASFGEWRTASKAFLAKYPDGWQTPSAPEVKVAAAAKAAEGQKQPEPPTHAVQPDGSVLLTNATPATIEIGVKPETTWVSSLRLEALPNAANNGTVFRKGLTSGTLTLAAAVRHADGKTDKLSIRYADAKYAEPRYANGFAMLGVHRGWRLSSAHARQRQVSSWLLDTPLRVTPGDTLVVTLPTVPAGCVRVAVSPFAPENPASATFPPSLRTALSSTDMSPAVLRAYLFGTAWNGEAFAKAKTSEANVFACRDGKTPVLVSESLKTPLVARVLPRGNWQDESGEIVQPAPPHFLTPITKPTPGKRLNRLDLAKWLVSPENPLTARVFVNRLWRQFYGNGISGLVEDLGAQGEWPTHPELLDWLAVEFRESGWNTKHIVRLMVTSATYRQSSSLRPELRDRDPNNRLLASQNPRRLEAEFVRDNALAIAGLLNTDVGGPPVKPYQPAGHYANIQFPNRAYDAETDERQYRRGIYTHWQRTFLHPMLVNFDAPSREEASCTRTVANTPQQALTLLNDPSYVEAARVFAQRLTAVKGATDAARLNAAYQQALGRPLKAKEKKSLFAFLATVRTEYRRRPDDALKLLKVGNAPAPKTTDPVELAAWTTVCRVVLNLQETITRY